MCIIIIYSHCIIYFQSLMINCHSFLHATIRIIYAKIDGMIVLTENGNSERKLDFWCGSGVWQRDTVKTFVPDSR